MKRLLLLFGTIGWLHADTKINNEVLDQLIQLLENDSATQSLIISNDERIIHEYYANNYSQNNLATSWSIAKTFYAALIGVAIQQDLIDYSDLEKPISYFVPELKLDSKSDITLYNILAMKTGLEITEYLNEEMFFSINNLDFAMNVDPKEEQGNVYEYNNVNTMLLNPIIESIFGLTPHEVLISEIFNPLNIKDYGLWKDSAGNDMTYYGVDLRPIDFMKFAHLVMNKGKQNGVQIIDEKFMFDSIQPISRGTGEWFGLHWSVRKFNESKTLVGLEVTDGQTMFLIPEERLAMVRFTKYFHNPDKGHQVKFGPLEYLLWMPYSWIKYITTLVAAETAPGMEPVDDPSINFPDTKSLGVSELNCPFTAPDECYGVSKIQDLFFGLGESATTLK